jgi:aspartate/methionine/tyrosine aminotransferase
MQSASSPSRKFPIRHIPFMGVIQVVQDALALGYDSLDPNWSNLGQGQPEVGEIPGAPERFSQLSIDAAEQAYGPVEGSLALRKAVAAHVNRLYRQGKKSRYTEENVVICPGGRTALTRLTASLDRIRLGYFVPDYSAYEDLLHTFEQVSCFKIELPAASGFSLTPEEVAERVREKALEALLISNPCNPTGRVMRGVELQAWLQMGRDRNLGLIFDEFYSHFIYEGDSPAEAGVSAAAFIDDVDEEPVFIVDGLTKNFRYPGWRVGWLLGPKEAVKNFIAAGSFVDGGLNHPIQKAAVAVLETARADQEIRAVRQEFSFKRNLTLRRLKAMGLDFPREPEGTFYAFASVANLPKPLDTAEGFYREALKNRVLTVPGPYFDIQVDKEKKEKSFLRNFLRFSYGPPRDNLVAGLDRLEKMIENFR